MLDETDDIHPLFYGAPASTGFRKLRKRIVRQTREVEQLHGMLAPAVKWQVCLSGGKGSDPLRALPFS